MRFAITANPCGNWPALEAVLRDIRQHGFSLNEVVCLGNVVGWYKYHRECVDAAMRFGLCFAGKYDQEVRREIHRRNVQMAAGMTEGEPGSFSSKSGRHFPLRWWITDSTRILSPEQKEALLSFPSDMTLHPHRFISAANSIDRWEDWKGRVQWMPASRADRIMRVRIGEQPDDGDSPEVGVKVWSSLPGENEEPWPGTFELPLLSDVGVEITLRGIVADMRTFLQPDAYDEYESIKNHVSWIAIEGRFITRHVVEFPWTETANYGLVV